MTVLEVIQRSADFLARKGVDSPRLQIELLLAHVLGLPRLQLYLNFDRPLSEQEMEAVRQLVRRRGQREPLQHLLGSTSFCGLEIAVNRDVLVPRPETEHLAELGWECLNACEAEPSRNVPPCALDFGTGSGCLAIALAVHCPKARLFALDLSPAALTLARQNAERHGVAEQIQFLQGDGLTVLPPDLRFDLIVANPPYIPTAEIPTLSPEVRDYDPRLALDGGPDGLDPARALAAHAAGCLLPAGRLLMEFGDGQETAVRELFHEPVWVVEAVENDLSGRARILIARPKSAWETGSRI